MTPTGHRLERLRQAYLRLRETLPQDTHTQERLYQAYRDLSEQAHGLRDAHSASGEPYRIGVRVILRRPYSPGPCARLASAGLHHPVRRPAGGAGGIDAVQVSGSATGVIRSGPSWRMEFTAVPTGHPRSHSGGHGTSSGPGMAGSVRVGSSQRASTAGSRITGIRCQATPKTAPLTTLEIAP